MSIMDQAMGPGDSMIPAPAQAEATVMNESGQQGSSAAANQAGAQGANKAANVEASQSGQQASGVASQGQAGQVPQGTQAVAGQQTTGAQAAGAQAGNASAQERKAAGQEQANQQDKPRSLLSAGAPVEQPISDWSKVDLQLGDARVDGELVESYGKLACEMKLTESQARALAHWQLEAIREQQERLVAKGQERLRKEWGASMNGNIQSVTQLCDRLARVPGLENFRQELEASGRASNPVVIKGLLHVAQLLREDSAGKIGGQGSHVETAEEGIRAAFARARGENV